MCGAGAGALPHLSGMSTQPKILDVARSVTYTPNNSAGPFAVPFPLFDSSGADLEITLNGVTVSGWALTSEAAPGFWGAPNTWINGNVNLSAPVTGTLVIKGKRRPRRVGQFAEGRGVPARDINTDLNILTAVARELFDNIEDLASRIIAGEVVLDARDDALAARDVALSAIGAIASMWASRAVAMAANIPAPVSYIRTHGYAAAGDGGGAVYKRVATPAVPKAWHFQSGDGAWWELAEKRVTPEMFGAFANDGVDHSQQLMEALGFTETLHLGPGKYIGSISIIGTKKIVGRGREATTLSSPRNNDNVITFLSGSGVLIDGLSITREVPATGSAIGIDARRTVGLSTIRNVLVSGHYEGVALGCTDVSVFEASIVQDNFGDGVLFTNELIAGPAQWYCRDILSQRNGGHGFFVKSAAGQGTVSVGKLTSCYTYGNGGYGFCAQGVSSINGVASIRLSDCFFGADGAGEIYLDTFGDTHEISGTYLELSGASGTGPGLGTPATNAGQGITITANNYGVQIIGCTVIKMAYSGIYSAAKDTVVSGCVLYNNGVAGVAGQRYGIHIDTTGGGVIVGNRAGQINTTTVQEYGLFCGSADLLVSANDLRGNAAGAIGGVAPAVDTGNRKT